MSEEIRTEPLRLCQVTTDHHLCRPFSVRTFPQWNYRTLNLHAVKTDDYETNEPLETTVLEALKQLLQLGVHISKQVGQMENPSVIAREGRCEIGRNAL